MLTILTILAQSENGASGGGFGSLIIFLLAIVVIAGMWKVFTKAGKPGSTPNELTSICGEARSFLQSPSPA